MLEFLSQCCPIYAKDLRRLALITIGEFHHGLEQRRFNLAEYQLVKVTRFITVQVLEVSMQRFFREIPQWAVS